METQPLSESYVEVEDVEEFEIPVFEASPAWWWWLKAFLCFALAVTAAIVFGIFVLPVLLDKVMIPILLWIASSFSKFELALMLIASLALFPVFLIPSGPSMWLSGMIFGYGIGFCIIMTGTSAGQSFPYFVGRFFFHERIQRWLKRWPKKAAVLRAAESGGFWFKFRAVTLLRLSPIPYTLFNYAIAATNIEFVPYIAGSVLGMIPEAFIAIYSGRLLRSLADAKHANRHLNAVEITYNLVGLCVAVATVVSVTVYGKRALREMEERSDDEWKKTNGGDMQLSELPRATNGVASSSSSPSLTRD